MRAGSAPRLAGMLPVVMVLWAVLARAQYPVGTADVTLVDPARGDRAVPVDLYYPATAAGAGQPVAIPAGEGGFPAVAFGHGFQMPAGAYAWVAGKLAAIGCVVAVPRTGGELFPSHAQFGQDLAFAARALRDAGVDVASPFHGRMSPRTLVMGHSMGGGCSLLAAAADPSLTAVAAFAAAETNPSAITAASALGRPTLLFAGSNDCVTPPSGHQDPMYRALAGWRALVTIDGASHCQFNAYNFLCDLGESCSAGITRQAQQDAAWFVLEPWVRWVLLLEPGAGSLFQARVAAAAGFSCEQAGGAAPVAFAPPGHGRRLSTRPNPFNPSTTIRFDPAGGGAVDLRVLDIRGRLVRTLLADANYGPGWHAVPWDGRDEAGAAVASGVYVVELNAGGARDSQRVLLLK